MTITDDINKSLADAVSRVDADRIVVVVDSNTAAFCLPAITIPANTPTTTIVIAPGDGNKNIGQLQYVWDEMMRCHASRRSLTVCIGGGVVTDLGGFAASTYMRGMPYVNIPTTLLATVDAATGGKTGINYNGVKNLVGAFASPVDTIIYPPFFNTLPFTEKLSGFAEMVKHALIADRQLLEQTLSFNLDRFDLGQLTTLIADNLRVKESIVAADPNETGIRKALNFGHTIGHALESLSLETEHPFTHGYAVMWGMVAELYLSMIEVGLDRKTVSAIAAFARENYPALPLSCRQYDPLFDRMRHDKKNHHNHICFTLLHDVGKPATDCICSDDHILEALDFITFNM